MKRRVVSLCLSFTIFFLRSVFDARVWSLYFQCNNYNENKQIIAKEPLITFLISFKRVANERKSDVVTYKTEFNLNYRYLTVEQQHQ